MTTSTASLLSISLLAFGTAAATRCFIKSLNSKIAQRCCFFRMKYGTLQIRLRYYWLY